MARQPRRRMSYQVVQRSRDRPIQRLGDRAAVNSQGRTGVYRYVYAECHVQQMGIHVRR